MNENKENNHSHHIVSDKIYNLTFISLIIFTVLTVMTSRVDLGLLNTPLALSIALLKATIVALFFMGVKWEKQINIILIWSAIIAVVLFFALTFSDVLYRGELLIEEKEILKIEPVHNKVNKIKNSH